MRIQDLGELEGDILLFGGVYSNLAALEALIAVAERLRIPPTHMLCSGDVVAYCAEAEASLQRIMGLGCPVLAGNCEVQLANDADDCGCGYDEGSTCSVLSLDWYRHARKEVTLESKAWMQKRPDRIVFTKGGKRFAMVHGGASNISKFVWPVATDAEIGAEITMLEQQVGAIDCVIAGHTGIQMDRTVDGVRWINAGAVGMPPNDGDPRGCYGILSGDQLSLKRLNYDAEKAKSSMILKGLTQGYDTTLTTGFWPSEDTLPPQMRVQSSAKG